MSNLEIGLCVVLVVVVLALVFLVWYFKDKVTQFEYEKPYYRLRDKLGDITGELIEANASRKHKDGIIKSGSESIKDLTDQLKQIKDLRELGKKSIIELNFVDGEDLALEEIEADKITFDGDLVVLSNAGKNVACLDRSMFVLHKYTLVDIEKPKEEK